MNEERRIALLEAIKKKDVDQIEKNLYYNFAYDFFGRDANLVIWTIPNQRKRRIKHTYPYN